MSELRAVLSSAVLLGFMEVPVFTRMGSYANTTTYLDLIFCR
jgi:hypothetical protein